MPETDMTDVAIGMMVGGAAGFALGRWSEKSNGKKQTDKLKAMMKKKEKDEKKGSKQSEKSKHSKHQRHHSHHSQGHYRPYQSMPLQHPHQIPYGRHPGHTTETTTMYSWNHPHAKHHQHHLPPPNHIPAALPHPQMHVAQHVQARSLAPMSQAPGPAQYGPSRYY